MSLKILENRTKKANRIFKSYQLANKVITEKNRVYTGTVSSIDSAKTSNNYTDDVINILQAAKLRQRFDFKIGSLRPKNGTTWHFIELTSKGKNKIFK